MSSSPYILAKIHADPILESRRLGLGSVDTSLDLNLSTISLAIDDTGLRLPDDSLLEWAVLEQIAKKENTCFAASSSGVEPIQRFSRRFNRSYALRATPRAPTLLVVGFPMHRIKNITPDQDTEFKIAAAGPLSGAVLDTTTGLGYTAIGAAKQGASVTTIELDPTVLEVARFNPWSSQLFDNDRITQRIGSSFDLIREYPDRAFNTIVHDPPTFSLAGELYSEEFYRQALRVLKPRGRLFHYVGDLDSKAGSVVAKGAVRRLQSAGFTKIVRHPEAFALVAFK